MAKKGTRFARIRTGDVVLDGIQSAAEDVFNQLEEPRRGLVAGEVRSEAGAATLAEDLFVTYTGRGGETLTLPAAAQRGRGKAQLMVISHEGTGTLTLKPPGDETLNGGKSLFVSPGSVALAFSNGFSKWKAIVRNDARDWNGYQHGATLGAGETWKMAGQQTALAVTTGAPTVNVLRAFPFIAPDRGGTCDRISFSVTVGGAGNGRVGLFDNTSDSVLYPSTRLADGGSVSVAGAGVKTANISVPLKPGRMYWLAHVQSIAATLQCLSIGGCAPSLGINPAMTLFRVGISVAFAFAPLPATFPGGGAYIDAIPIPALAARIA